MNFDSETKQGLLIHSPSGRNMAFYKQWRHPGIRNNLRARDVPREGHELIRKGYDVRFLSKEQEAHLNLAFSAKEIKATRLHANISNGFQDNESWLNEDSSKLHRILYWSETASRNSYCCPMCTGLQFAMKICEARRLPKKDRHPYPGSLDVPPSCLAAEGRGL
jgi:hypothetical protein